MDITKLAIPRTLVIIFFVLSIPITLIGCETSKPPRRPLALSEEFRKQLATIGITSANFHPEAQLKMPAKGSISGAGEGAKAGAAVGAMPGLGLGGYPSVVIGLPLAAAGAIVGTLIGGGYGALAVEPEATVEEAEESLRKAISELKIQEALQEHVVNEARKETRYHFVPISEFGPKERNGETDYSNVEKKFMASILELSVLNFGLEEEFLGPTPPLAMFIETRVRIIRLADKMPIYDHLFTYKTGFFEYTYWSADNGKHFLDALNDAYQRLAEQIVYELFLLYPMPNRIQAGTFWGGVWLGSGPRY